MAEIESSGTPVDTGDNEDFDTESNSGETLAEDGQQDDVEAGDDNSQETVADGFDPNSITDPNLLAAYKQMQASFTPKLQEAARLREQYGELQPEVVDAVRHYQQLLQTDPYAAREFLTQQQSWLDQQLGQTQQPADPFEGIEALTPAEEAMLSFARQQHQRNLELERELQQQRFSRQQETAERQFAQLEAQYKVSIPLEEKQKAYRYAQQQGLNDVSAAWKLMNFDKLVGNSRTEKSAQTKASKAKSPPPPTNKQQRSAPATKQAKGLSSIFDEAWDQFRGG